MTSLYNTDYLKHLCQKYGLVPSKKYGQNFLIHPVKSPQGGVAAEDGQFNRVNEDPITKMIEAAEIKPDDVVVEVGPGFGVLTLALAKKVKKVISFEIEKKLEPYWQEQMTRHKNIEIVWGNVLKVDLSSILPLKREEVAATPLFKEGQGEVKSKAGAGGGQYKVIANLPYQITSNVIRKFLETDNKPELMVLMVQKEVVERICAKPGDMSVLAVSVQYYADPEIISLVPKSYFWPAPAVDSAIIKLRLKKLVCHSDRASQRVEESLIPDERDPSATYARDDNRCDDNEHFFKIVKAGFANRRKMLIKNLSSVADKKKLLAIFQELGINEKVRAQELSVEQWRGLTRRMESAR